MLNGLACLDKRVSDGSADSAAVKYVCLFSAQKKKSNDDTMMQLCFMHTVFVLGDRAVVAVG